MDITLFSALLKNLLHMDAIRVDTDGEAPRLFENRYCYDGVLQPLFTEQFLSQLLADVEDGILYDLRDGLGVCAVFFCLGGELFLVGPFVRSEFDPVRVRGTLIRNQMPAAAVPSIRLYYNAFPLVSAT